VVESAASRLDVQVNPLWDERDQARWNESSAKRDAGAILAAPAGSE